MSSIFTIARLIGTHNTIIIYYPLSKALAGGTIVAVVAKTLLCVSSQIIIDKCSRYNIQQTSIIVY